MPHRLLPFIIPAIGGILGHFSESLPAYAAALCSAVAAFQTWMFLPESRVHRESEAEAWLHPSRFLPIIRNSPLLQMLLIFFFRPQGIFAERAQRRA